MGGGGFSHSEDREPELMAYPKVFNDTFFQRKIKVTLNKVGVPYRPETAFSQQWRLM